MLSDAVTFGELPFVDSAKEPNDDDSKLATIKIMH